LHLPAEREAGGLLSVCSVARLERRMDFDLSVSEKTLYVLRSPISYHIAFSTPNAKANPSPSIQQKYHIGGSVVI
jgi:hypothetical protein